MVRHYVCTRKKKFGQFLLRSVLSYIRRTGTSIRETSKMFSIPRTTLQRRVHRNKVVLSRGSRPILRAEIARDVFRKSVDAESRTEVRKIAYQTALQEKVVMPRSWLQKEIAGVDWCLNFLKKYPYLDYIIKKIRGSTKDLSFECCVCEELFYESTQITLCKSCCKVKCFSCYNPSKCLQKESIDE